MRKLMSFVFIIALLFGMIAAMHAQPSVVKAQDGTALEFGEWIEGSLTADDFDHSYTFTGTAGDIVLIEMYRKPGEFGLDPELMLLDSAGGTIGENDNFVVLGAVIVREIATDGEYTVVAQRSGGSDGSSEGLYILRATLVELVGPGDTLTATINSEDASEYPDVFVMRAEADAVWSFAYAHEGGELYPEILVESWTGDTLDDAVVFELANTENTRSGVINGDIEGGTFYVLTVSKALFAFVFDDIEANVTVTIGEAE